MTSIREAIRRMVAPVKPLESGTYHFQSDPASGKNYRLHLRLEPDGNGLLIVNAQTVLHLNQTAAEYAYHIIKGTPEESVARQIASRYKVSFSQAGEDYISLRQRIETLIQTPDLDPEIFLDFGRTMPHGSKLSAPLRLDCALTYKLPEGINPDFSPNSRVIKELNTSEWKKIIDLAWEVGIPHLIFTGGEPTLRVDLPDLIREAEANGQVTGLITDGLRLGEPAYLNELLLTGLDHILFVLQPENEKAWKALSDVLAADVFVAVHLTVTESNADRIQELVDRLSRLGVKAISLSVQDTRLMDKLASLRNYASELGLELVWDIPVPYGAMNPVAMETSEDNPPPGAGHSWLYVEPDGDILAGQGLPKVMGNFLTDPWDKIWNG